MEFGGIGKRYAQALFDASLAEEVVDQVHDDVVSFGRVLETETSFHRFLVSLQVMADQKKDMVARVIGDRASGLFVKFIMLLIDKKRIGVYAEIANAFVSLYEAHAGILRVGVITAVELDPALERKAKETIERRTGRTARVVKRIDPAIIGGMIMFAGDRVIDGSIRNQLHELRKQLLDTRVN